MKSPIVRSSDNFVDSARTARLTLDIASSREARERQPRPQRGTIPRSMNEGMKHVISGNTLHRGPICA
jgi:hypothetical protein